MTAPTLTIVPATGPALPLVVNLVPQVVQVTERATATIVLSLMVEPGILGLDIPTPAFTTVPVSGGNGDDLLATRYEPRDVAIPILVETDDMRHAVRAIAHRLNLRDGDLSITLRYPDGDVRTLNHVRYVGGLEGDESADSAGAAPSAGDLAWRRLVLSFRALDPYWYGAPAAYIANASAALAWSAAGVAWSAAGQPWSGTSGVTGVPVTVFVGGDADALPVGTIHGPGSFVITHVPTGAQWISARALTASEVVTIDTDAGVVYVNGVRDWSVLSAASTLWRLAKGDNPVTFTMSGATTTASSVTLTWSERWLTA